MNTPRLYFIYRIVCFPTFKMYIGLTCNPRKRKKEHYRLLRQGNHYNVHLQRAFKNYGEHAFYFEIIEKDISGDNVDARERHWIASFDSYQNGFNESPGGGLSYRGKSCQWNGIQYSSISAAAAANGVENSTMRERLEKGYSCDEDIIPFGVQCNKPCEWNGVKYPSQKAAAQALGISKEAMKGRLASGYTSDSEMTQRTPCIWNGIAYPSITDCAHATGIARTTLLRWFKMGIVRDEDRPIYRKIING